MTKTDTRELIVGTLLEVTSGKEFCHIALRQVLDKYQYMEKQQRAFLTRVTEGTLERMLELDYILDQFSKVPVRKMKPFIRNLLRMSVYQMKYMDRVPDAAVCNEAVKLARKKGFANLTGFVNGVLRSIARGLEELKYPEDLPGREAEYLSVRYSMPQWITEKWLEEYGRSVTESMLASFLEPSGTTIRVNTQRISPGELQKRLQAQGIQTEEEPGLPYALHIEGYDSLGRIPAFREGLFFVQDVSSMLAVEAAKAEKDSFCLDVCAAPGGKAMQLSMLLEGSGSVEARDLTDYKVRSIEENVERLQVANVRGRVYDARILDTAMIEKADVVLADLPCSGLGVLGRKPDIKYRTSLESLASLAELQRQILDTVWQYVKPGGTLIYSTCTVNPQENEENVSWFLQKYPFQLEALPPVFAGFADEEACRRGMCQLLPGDRRTDGFFIARLRRSLTDSGKTARGGADFQKG
ncbi:MAG: 16S rRNA (cytosine(967)-C(5))-methyltransferase RsmB [Lachnospiraceae bacterium]|nr:16S rRNA (cytosine(967)-C(5))-methyltransferase RsmB [Lachnospiraceae bacterium]